MMTNAFSHRWGQRGCRTDSQFATCMDVFEASQHLIQKELVVLRCQVIVCLNHLAQVLRAQA